MHPTHKPATTTDQPEPGWSPADTLRAVATYLQRHGWTQGAYYASISPPLVMPSACVLGAFGMVLHGEPLDNPEAVWLPEAAAYQAARTVLLDHLVDADNLGVYCLGDWNDTPGRTVEQIISACRNAADAYDRAHHTGSAA